jgi:putative membrane protein
MKNVYLSIAILLGAVLPWSCNSNNTATSDTIDSTDSRMNTDDSVNTLNNAANQVNTTPMSKDDSTFVMEAAVGGLMEVEAGNLAQQLSTNQRGKDFASMMVRDHSQANTELKSMVTGRMMLPDSLPSDKRKHMESMRKMSGKAFDRHYVNMMVTDHAKDIDKFTKASTSATDAQLKSWAAGKLPTLQMHKDSVDALKKMKF